MKEIGYINGEPIYYHFLIPEIEIDYGLLPLGNDSDVLLLSKHVANHKEIMVYTEHGTTRLHTYFMSPNKVVLEEINEPISPELNRKKFTSTEVGSCSRKLDLNENYDFSRSVVPFGHFDRDVLKDVGVQPASEELNKAQDVGPLEDFDPFFYMDHNDYQQMGDDDYQQMGDNEEIGDAISDETSTNGSISEDSDFLVDELNMVEDVEVNMKDFHSGVYSFPNLDNHQSFNAPDVTVDDDLEVIDTQLFESAGVEEDERKKLMRRGVVPEMTGGPWTKSRIKCKDKTVSSQKATCPWVVLISRSDEESDWMVKTLVHEHRCVQSRSIKACTSKFLATTILQQVEGNPTIPVKALRVELQKTYEVGMSRMKVFRAKQLAHKHVHGDYEKQYSLLRDYCNPGTTVKIDVYSEPNANLETRMFKRIYVCLGALKLGFKAGLRDFLGFDGAFMKGPYPGQVLTAVGLDSNNGIYPLTYAIVEAENKSSWSWFLECLGEDLELSTNSNFTFISDRQKGILPAIANLFPSAEHRFCLRHIHENMKLQWRGKEHRDHLWECATTTTVRHFDRFMEDFNKFNSKACDWLKKIPPKHWARAHISGRAHTDILLNNLCEVFNSKLLDARDKPIITCLEYIREYLMKRICIVQNVIDKSQGPLTPTATKLLDGVKKDASQYTCIFNGAEKTQVTGTMGEQFVVNWRDRNCSCRHTEITGIPCSHLVSAIWDKVEHGAKNVPPLEEWVHPCYRLSTWNEMYKYKVQPINGRSMWPKSDCPTTLTPPKHTTQVGRPKKKRKRAQTEEPNNQGKSLTRKFLTVTCSKCKNKGHNSRSCKGQGGQTEVRNVVAGSKKLSKAKKQGDGKKEKPKMKEKTKLKDKSKMKEKV
uniref:SWIM-type domain-containing protein n=1 Tax=Lactuca sativa TaxID=4236 RepID=A0A9R1XSW4_LACSA|nr:hypothetical protein LSAT_V11C200094290 [Lactuca sativa]